MRNRILVFILISLFSVRLKAQINTNYPWGENKEYIKSTAEGFFIKDFNQSIRYKTKSLNYPTITEYFFDNDELTEVHLKFRMDELNEEEVWKAYKSVEEDLNIKMTNILQLESATRAKFEKNTATAIWEINKKDIVHYQEWQDSLSKCQLVLDGKGTKNQMSLIIIPSFNISNSSLNDNTSTEPNSNMNANQFKQRLPEKINIVKAVPNKFYYRGTKLNYRELYETMANNQFPSENNEVNINKHVEIMKSSKNEHAVASVLTLIGSAMMGWSLGQSITQPSVEYNPTLGLVGIAVSAVGLTVSISSSEKRLKAVNLYNSRIP